MTIMRRHSMELSIFGRSAKSVYGICDVNYEAQWKALKVNALIFAASVNAYRHSQLSSASRANYGSYKYQLVHITINFRRVSNQRNAATASWCTVGQINEKSFIDYIFLFMFADH